MDVRAFLGFFSALKAAEMVGIPRLSVVNVVGSAIARETKMGVYLNAGRETAVASTKAFTTQVCGYLIYLYIYIRLGYK